MKKEVSTSHSQLHSFPIHFEYDQTWQDARRLTRHRAKSKKPVEKV